MNDINNLASIISWMDTVIALNVIIALTIIITLIACGIYLFNKYAFYEEVYFVETRKKTLQIYLGILFVSLLALSFIPSKRSLALQAIHQITYIEERVFISDDEKKILNKLKESLSERINGD